MKPKTLKVNLVIHLFAVAHAITTVIFGYFNINDDIPLTILTILMIIMVTRVYDFPLDISAAFALLSCFAGFYIGTKGASIIESLSDGRLNVASNVITTFIVTEILGWTAYFIARKRKYK